MALSGITTKISGFAQAVAKIPGKVASNSVVSKIWNGVKPLLIPAAVVSTAALVAYKHPAVRQKATDVFLSVFGSVKAALVNHPKTAAAALVVGTLAFLVSRRGDAEARGAVGADKQPVSADSTSISGSVAATSSSDQPSSLLLLPPSLAGVNGSLQS